jgi:hypothetical protein
MPDKKAYYFGNMKALEISHVLKELDLVHGLLHTHTHIYAISYPMSLYLKHGIGTHVMAYFSQCWKCEKLESTANTFT